MKNTNKKKPKKLGTLSPFLPRSLFCAYVIKRSGRLEYMGRVFALYRVGFRFFTKEENKVVT